MLEVAPPSLRREHCATHILNKRSRPALDGTGFQGNSGLRTVRLCHRSGLLAAIQLATAHLALPETNQMFSFCHFCG